MVDIVDGKAVGEFPPEDEDFVPGRVKVSTENTLGRDTVQQDQLNEKKFLSTRTDAPGIVDAVGLAITSGDNFAYQVYNRIEREAANAPEADFNPDTYLRAFGKDIPEQYHKQIKLAGSTGEADAIRQDINRQLHDREKLERMGLGGGLVASGLAGIVDLDFPLMFTGVGAAGKLGMASTRMGRLMYGAGEGALILGTGSALATAASPVGDWADVPVAALGGMAFGAFGGGIAKLIPEHAANNAIGKQAKEFDATIREGAPLASRDIRTERHVPSGPIEVDPQTGAPATVGRKPVAVKIEEAIPEKPAGEPAEALKGPVLAKPGQVLDEGLSAIPEPLRGPLAKRMDEALADVRPEVDADTTWVQSKGPKLANAEDVIYEAGDTVGGGSSIGARQMGAQSSIAIESRDMNKTVTDARVWEQQNGVINDYYYGIPKHVVGDVRKGVLNAARRFHDVVTSSKFLATDFDRMMKSGSVVAQKLAYDLMESAAGIVRNNYSASMLREHYEKNLLGVVMPDYQDGFNAWGKSKGYGLYDRVTKANIRRQFDESVIAELQGRAYDPPGTVRNVDPHVESVANAIDRWSSKDIEIGKGRAGEISVKGYESLDAYSGYFPQKWSGRRMTDLIRSGRVAEKQLIKDLAWAYTKMHNLAPDDARKFAKAIYLRSKTMERGADTNLMGILQGDGKQFLEESLRNSGMANQHEIDKLMDRLIGAQAQRGQLAQTKGRVDMDLRMTLPSGIRLMDLVETDIGITLARRARGTSGAAALARKGIASRADRQHMIDTIMAEQQSRGHNTPSGTGAMDKVNDFIDRDLPLTRQELEDMFSYFDAGPISGGISPTYSRMKKLTNLALLNQLGLTQMAETGVTIASVGLSRFFDYAGPEFMGMLKNKNSPLVDELKHFNIFVPEERIYNAMYALEYDKGILADSVFMQNVDRLLNQGQRIQGFTSGFYNIRTLQQRIAITSGADKIMSGIAGKAEGYSAARLADIGIDPALTKKLENYITSGVVEFQEGRLKKLNLNDWAPEDVEAFSLTMNRMTNQLIQKAMIGESSLVFHKDGLASLFFHLKSFPMLAMHKQAERSMRLMDTESAMGFMAGMITASAAYTAKQVINGKGDDLDPVKIANGAFGLSNMTGWIPMWTDPVASMLGMDSLKFNQYSRGIDSNVLSTPAALPTLNRMVNLPRAAIDAVDLSLDNSSVRSLQAMPIVGNAYGFTYIWNKMKERPTPVQKPDEVPAAPGLDASP